MCVTCAQVCVCCVCAAYVLSVLLRSLRVDKVMWVTEAARPTQKHVRVKQQKKHQQRLKLEQLSGNTLIVMLCVLVRCFDFFFSLTVSSPCLLLPRNLGGPGTQNWTLARNLKSEMNLNTRNNAKHIVEYVA